jgi:hypothetical protein
MYELSLSKLIIQNSFTIKDTALCVQEQDASPVDYYGAGASSERCKQEASGLLGSHSWHTTLQNSVLCLLTSLFEVLRDRLWLVVHLPHPHPWVHREGASAGSGNLAQR